VLEPQSTALFIGLMLVFAALTWWMLTARPLVFRVLAACLAFLPAMAFGVLAVNKYYGYYQTWGAAINDFTNQGAKAGAGVPDTDLTARRGHGTLNGSKRYLRQAQQQGYPIRLTVTGARSHLTRVVYAYLPPQYFQPAYSGYRFPVIELIHGQPGEPQDWINVVGVTTMLGQLMARHLARPVVLVMPSANGARRISLQCLNQVHGPQDLTYLAEDLPDRISHLLRVQPPGPAWGVAGYSEGGFCAANMALRFRHRYGFAGVLSGYFKPADNQLVRPLRQVSPFGGSTRLRLENTPLYTLPRLPGSAAIPRFWLGAGVDNPVDVASVQAFWRELAPRQPQVPLVLTRDGGHDMLTWRAEVPLMLRWMTPLLAQAARQEAATQAKAAHAKAAQAKAARSKAAQAQAHGRKRAHHHAHTPVVTGISRTPAAGSPLPAGGRPAGPG
jgi:enterochelin esterase-like enzyme